MSFLSRAMVLKSKAHFSASTTGIHTDHAAFEGARKKRAAQAKSRVGLLISVSSPLRRRRRPSGAIWHGRAGDGVEHRAGRQADGVAP